MLCEMREILKGNTGIWDLFTRRDEYSPFLVDKFGRCRYTGNPGTIFEPTASRFLIEHGFRPEYPDGRTFAVCLTHDIDAIYEPVLHKAGKARAALMQGGFRDSLGMLLKVPRRCYPWVNFDSIVSLEERYDARSSFFFLSLEPGDMEFSYAPRDIGEEIGDLVDRGCEVGLHGDFRAYHDSESLDAQKRRLEGITGKPLRGFRSHFLRFRIPESWEILSRAGFLYDTTYGYADVVGFRNGMCHPFRPFNLRSGEEIGILEIPLAVMDGTLWDYMRLDMPGSWKIIQHLVDAVAGCRGVLTILWHNTSMESNNLALYEKVLAYCHGKGAWMPTMVDLADWWTKSRYVHPGCK
jgi:peptidoglycan/xylan/chitin deacetylase (PgdA/CDA1 family)